MVTNLYILNKFYNIYDLPPIYETGELLLLVLLLRSSSVGLKTIGWELLAAVTICSSIRFHLANNRANGHYSYSKPKWITIIFSLTGAFTRLIYFFTPKNDPHLVKIIVIYFFLPVMFGPINTKTPEIWPEKLVWDEECKFLLALNGINNYTIRVLFLLDFLLPIQNLFSLSIILELFLVQEIWDQKDKK